MAPYPRRAVLGKLAAGCSVGIVAGNVSLPQTASRRGDHQPRLIAHRGCTDEAPENTLPAVRRAGRAVDAVEVDVRRAGSGELVAIHDATVDHVTGASGAVDALSLEELQSLSVGGTDASIPTLESLFEVVPDSTAFVFELKTSGLVDDVLSLADDHPHEVLLSSFDSSIVAAATDAGAETALIVRETWLGRRFRDVAASDIPLYPRQPVREFLETALSLECRAIHPRLELCLETDLVARAHENGLLVEPWTITTAGQATDLAAIGVDGLITDRCTALF
ncbi:glycerophosphodiester phosphodiesterase [Saliphagus sp. GCM10025334]